VAGAIGRIDKTLTFAQRGCTLPGRPAGQPVLPAKPARGGETAIQWTTREVPESRGTDAVTGSRRK